jgi:hypothetical protein
LVLFAGRRLFWFFVGVAGFFFGFNVAASFLENQPFWMTLLIAAGCGLIGALLALFLQRLAIFLAGFLAGGYILISLLYEFHVRTGHLSWLYFVLGGIAGAVLLSVLFDWALIFLSSVAGSLLIVKAYHPGPGLSKLFIVILFVAGFAVQAMGMRHGRAGVRNRKT